MSKSITKIALQLITLLALNNNANALNFSEIENIKLALSEQPHKQVYLVIGVRCGEELFDERFGHLFTETIFPIFGDINSPITDLSGHYLTANFDDPNVLQQLQAQLANTFDVIITDGLGTTKFLRRWNDTTILTVSGMLKSGGRLFYHDWVNVNFYKLLPRVANVLALTENEFGDLDTSLRLRLPAGFNPLPAAFFLPEAVIANLETNDVLVEERTEQVFKIIKDYQPRNFIKAINEIVELGLKDAGLTQGPKFTVATKDEIRPRIIRVLKEREFTETKLSNFVEQVLGVNKDLSTISLGAHFTSIELVRAIDDHESLNIVKPKHHDGIGSFVYIFRK